MHDLIQGATGILQLIKSVNATTEAEAASAVIRQIMVSNTRLDEEAEDRFEAMMAEIARSPDSMNLVMGTVINLLPEINKSQILYMKQLLDSMPEEFRGQMIPSILSIIKQRDKDLMSIAKGLALLFGTGIVASIVLKMKHEQNKEIERIRAVNRPKTVGDVLDTFFKRL